MIFKKEFEISNLILEMKSEAASSLHEKATSSQNPTNVKPVPLGPPMKTPGQAKDRIVGSLIEQPIGKYIFDIYNQQA